MNKISITKLQFDEKKMKRNSSAGLERNENEMSLQAKYKHEEKAEKTLKD